MYFTQEENMYDNNITPKFDDGVFRDATTRQLDKAMDRLIVLSFDEENKLVREGIEKMILEIKLIRLDRKWKEETGYYKIMRNEHPIS